MNRFAMMGLALALAIVPASANHHMTISGYIDVSYADVEGDISDVVASGGFPVNAPSVNGNTGAGNNAGGAAPTNTAAQGGTNSRFALNEVNLDIRAELTDNMQTYVSLDSIRGGALAVDEGWIEWSNPGSFDLNVRAGHVPSSIGIETRWKESNETVFNSLSLISGFTVGASEGLQAYGTWSPINWQVAITNHDPVGTSSTGSAIAAQTTVLPNNNGATGENNENKFISGRLGVLPIEGLEVGISGATGQHNTTNGGAGATDLRRQTLGVDLQYRYGPFNLVGEYLSVEEDVLGAPDDDLTGFYVQGTYDFTDQITFGLRFSDVDVDAGAAAGQFQTLDYSQISILGAYDLAENVMVKLQYDINDEDVNRAAIGGANSVATGGEPDNDGISLAVVASF